MNDQLLLEILAELRAIREVLSWGLPPQPNRDASGMTWTRPVGGTPYTAPTRGIRVETTTDPKAETKLVPM